MKKLNLLLVCLVSVLNINAEIYLGLCGDNAKYSLDTSTGLLSITGTGAMTDYGYGINAPWYSNRSYIKTVNIADGITSIGGYAFNKCEQLKSVTISNSVTSIGEEAFSGCSCLTSIEIPNSITSIGNGIFQGCSSLETVTIPNSVTSIGWYAFSGCGLTSFEIPNSVTEIAWFAFSGCSCLTSIEIPNSITSIGSAIFQGCSSLESVTIPNSVTSIGTNVFSNCSKLSDVYCYAENAPTTEINTFKNFNIEKATLHVTETSINAYKTTSPWSGFGTIVIGKCAKPTISFVDGKIIFNCETEDVEYVYHINPIAAIDGNGNNISLPTIMVTVYATKQDFENSDVATKEINLGTSGVRGDLNGDGVVNMPDAMFIVNKMLKDKFPDE